MNENREELLAAINRKMAILEQEIGRCRDLIKCVLTGIDNPEIGEVLKGSPLGQNDSGLKEIIKEAIDVLEESRKAFKSKKLELLRKRLVEALAEY
ncbi:MAG: hypothetical protein AAGU11_04175 [Syntrophobacteraceae bacterium]